MLQLIRLQTSLMIDFNEALYMLILLVKENIFVLRSLQNDWHFFRYKNCNLPFLAICRSQYPLLIFFASSWYQKAKITLRTSLRNKEILWTKRPIEEKMINVILEGFIKCYKTKSVWVLFLFSYKSVCKFWKTEYKNVENLKILKEIFCQKFIVSNIILACLDHLKPKNLFVGQPGGLHRAPFFKICWTALAFIFEATWLMPQTLNWWNFLRFRWLFFIKRRGPILSIVKHL